MSGTIQLGISTCPNDTFAFHGLMHDRIDRHGLDFEIHLLDVQELNRRLLEGQFDVAKASFHAALLMTDQVGVLPSGSALGFGVGPLLLAAERDTHPADSIPAGSGSSRPARVLCPGQQTTATLLYRMFYPGAGQIQQAVFSEIMPALVNQEVDFGVCIHEGRFTWQQQGLSLVEDLGTRWERETQTPLPLGGIVARHRLGAETLQKIQSVIQQSIQYGLQHRDKTITTMRHYAQEFSDEVLMAHVDLYVNQWTVDLGTIGKNALDHLNQYARRSGILSGDANELEVIGR